MFIKRCHLNFFIICLACPVQNPDVKTFCRSLHKPSQHPAMGIGYGGNSTLSRFPTLPTTLRDIKGLSLDRLQVFYSCVCLPVFFESPREVAREVIIMKQITVMQQAVVGSTANRHAGPAYGVNPLFKLVQRKA